MQQTLINTTEASLQFNTSPTMPYNGASNGSGVGGAVAGSSVSGGGATIVVSEGPQNKKIRTGVQQPGENDVNMHARVS